ncbi:MAG: hypothetical protein WCI11_14560 [Candidatus Methylumidiphilus sp.]
MASDNYALNFVEYMKGVGDSAVNLAQEGAYGVYDFGQVAVGGGKILAKEGLSAIGATEAAANIVLEDIQPLSSLGKVAAQGGYQGLGEAVKDLPGNVASAVADAARQGDMRALGSAVTDAALLADGAASAAKGLATGARRAAGAAGKAIDKSKAALAKAAKTGNSETTNDAVARCGKQNDVASRQSKQTSTQKAAFGEKTAHDKMLQRQMEPLGSTDGQYQPGKTGIDGVYKNHSPPPAYIITEAKYGTSKLGWTKDGKQMSNDWLTDRRLMDKVGEENAVAIRDAINSGNVEKRLINVREDGSARMIKLDNNANKIGNWTEF